MNIFGFEIKRNCDSFIKRSECHRAQDGLKDYIKEKTDDIINNLNIRIDDVKDYIDKNGK